MLKKLLGLAPKLEADGSYSPSKVALKLATNDKTDYDDSKYQKYTGKKSKIGPPWKKNSCIRPCRGSYLIAATRSACVNHMLVMR